MDMDVNALRAEWSDPTRVHFGAGRVNDLPDLLAGLNIRHPLFVTDPNMASLSPFRHAVSQCEQRGIRGAVFQGVLSNPTLDHATDGADAFRRGGHDGLVAFGGGSPIDVAKTIALLVGEDRPLAEFELPGKDQSAAGLNPLPPLIAIPTTAGSGAEMRTHTLISDPATRRKLVFRHPGLLPRRVILDPVLTIELPPLLTAAGGMNALAYNLEAYCAPGFDPAAEGMAAEGVRLARRHLPEAFHNGQDLVARSMMMASAALGGLAFRRGLGGIQALANPVAAQSNAHHGLATAVLAPYVLAFNRPAVEPRLARLAGFLGLEKPGFDSLMTCLLSLRRELGIPESLGGLGMGAVPVEALVQAALADPFAPLNPRPLDAEGVARLYHHAIEGRLDGL